MACPNLRLYSLIRVAINSGPEAGDPGTRGPEDQGPEDPSTEGCFALQQLPIAKIQL